MWKDPIVEEVRAARDAYAKKFGYDIDKIVRDLRKKAAKPAKRPATPKSTKPTKRKRRAA
ncbi:MAG: hypothetical protein AABZ53_07570 [Planctomycetota bacterium]